MRTNRAVISRSAGPKAWGAVAARRSVSGILRQENNFRHSISAPWEPLKSGNRRIGGSEAPFWWLALGAGETELPLPFMESHIRRRSSLIQPNPIHSDANHHAIPPHPYNQYNRASISRFVQHFMQRREMRKRHRFARVFHLTLLL